MGGKWFTGRKRFEGVKRVRKPFKINAEAWEDEMGFFCVAAGPIVNMDQVAQKMWPLGSELEVHYNPANPEVHYIGAPVKNKFLRNFMGITGAGLILAGIILYFLIV